MIVINVMYDFVVFIKILPLPGCTNSWNDLHCSQKVLWLDIWWPPVSVPW